MNTLVELQNVLAPYGVNLEYLLTDSNPKIQKSKEKTFISHLRPERAVCSHMGLCEHACLHNAGNPAYWSTKERARAARTNLYKENRQLFLYTVAIAMAKKRNRHPGCAFRLNGTSDIPYEHKSHRLAVTTAMLPLLHSYGVEIEAHSAYTIPELFPDNQLYDYTKVCARLQRKLPPNYDLTFSLDGPQNAKQALWALQNGFNVAVPFYELPDVFYIDGFRFNVINGDLSDYRPSDPRGVIVGLKYKRITNGKKFTNNGFVIEDNRIETNQYRNRNRAAINITLDSDVRAFIASS